MDLVLRKRISLNIYKRQSITERLKKSKWLGRADNAITQSGVTYEVVSNIPKASEELEDRESLAQLAASGDDCAANDGETYIEKYTRGVSAVESILTLDRLRQSVAIKELEQTHGQPLSMRKTVSVPNFSQVSDIHSISHKSFNCVTNQPNWMRIAIELLSHPQQSIKIHSFLTHTKQPKFSFSLSFFSFLLLSVYAPIKIKTHRACTHKHHINLCVISLLTNQTLQFTKQKRFECKFTKFTKNKNNNQ